MSNKNYSSIFGEKKICPNPFLTLVVYRNGDVSVCCTDRLKEGHKYVGNTLENTLDEIWNGERIKRFRQMMYKGEYGDTCKSFCPQLIAFKKGEVPPWYSEYCDEDTYEEIKKERTALDSSYKAIDVASDGSCNLSCIMCRTDYKTGPTEEETKVNAVLYGQILENISKIHFLELTGAGDPFFNKNVVWLLDNLALRDVSHLTVRFITNAQLLNEKLWGQIKKLKIKALRISVSIDAATKETYESIRLGGKWEVLMRNMKMLAEKRLSGELDYLQVTYVVMRRNISEMVKFIDLARSWGCDRIDFQRIYGLTAGLENIFDIEDPKSLERLAVVLKDPVFDEPFVDVSPISSYKNYQVTPESLKRYRREVFNYKMKSKIVDILVRTKKIFKGLWKGNRAK